MDKSFNNLMESFSASDRDDDPVKCTCKNTCSTKLCPCKSTRQNCSVACKCGTKKKSCSNKTIPEDSEDEDVDETSDTDDESSSQSGPNSRKRTRESTTDMDADLRELTNRNAEENRQIKDFLRGLSANQLREICTDLLQRSPGAFADYIMVVDDEEDDGGDDDDANTEATNDDRPTASASDVNSSSELPPPSPPSPDPRPRPPRRPQTPRWCKCQRCKEMPRQIENKCCRPRHGQPCVSITAQFQRLCLDHMVLEVAMRVNEDLMAEVPLRNNDSFRHQAYRTYIYWQHGRLGAGNRRVIPSCCVWKIRNMWPDAHKNYRGFIEGAGHLQD